jgi:hypothetical protein
VDTPLSNDDVVTMTAPLWEHHVYRDPDAIPEDVYRRIGKEKPTR